MSWILVASVAVPALGAGLLAALSIGRDARRADRARSVAVWSSGITVVAAVAVLVSVAADGRLDVVAENDDGRALFGLTAARIEASLLVLTSFVGLIVQSYASRSLRGDARAVRFHGLALGLVAATNLAAVAASGATFVVGWVGTSIVVAALVAHRRGWHAADQATLRTQRAFGIGDLALLAGIVMATTSAGHFDLRAVGDVVVQMDSDGAVTLVALLLIVAGVARSALIPLGTWLPATLAAPTPVSALLHAGVVNGAGVLVIRFHPLIGESTAALVVAYLAGVATAVLATAIMIVRTDVKGSLVWSTAGQMGFMVAQLGAGAFAAAFFHLIGHAMYKAAAFLGAGEPIPARNRRSFRPSRHGRASVASVVMSLGIAGASVAGAMALLDPHLNDAGTVLVATFATLTLARAVHGWVVTTALAATVVVPAAAIGSILAALAYVGGLKVVEGFIVNEVPFEVPAAVGAAWVVATVALVAGLALLVTRCPGPRGAELRRATYARLVGFGSIAAPTDRAAGGPTGTVDPTPAASTPAASTPAASTPAASTPSVGTPSVDNPASATPSSPAASTPAQAAQRARLVADVATAGGTVAPSWPVTTFVAVNPLGSFTDRPFHDAVSEGRRWFGADGYLPLSTSRSLAAAGEISTADLDQAIMRHDGLFSVPWELQLGGRAVDAVEVVRHDLLNGPESPPDDGGPIGSPAVDRIVATWCATFVDDDHVAWAMPDRDQGFYRAWRVVAGHDPALRALAGHRVRAAIAALPEDPYEAIERALDALGVDSTERVNQLRAWLLRTPGWAGFARWCDDWAPVDHPGVRLRAVDLIAVRAALETVVPPTHRTTPPVDRSAVDPSIIAARVGSLVDEFGEPDERAAEDLRSIVTIMTDAARRAVFLAAHEGRVRDTILTTIDRSAATSRNAVADEDLAAQVVCCIDVRSEGLRRRLEALGAYETFGFAGFFGVPVRWRPLGSEVGQARCPVLVTPQHEVVEQPVGGEADGFVRREAARLGVGEAKHAAMTGLGSPFAMAESMGWITGPLAAARTLLPARRPTRDRPESTEPVVRREGGGELNSGLSLDERTLFAEAIIATIGFRRFAPIVVLCGHGAATINNPHGSSLDCGACGGAPGGASARIAAGILNDPEVREALLARSIDVPATTVFVAAEHDTVSDTVEFFDVDRLAPAWHDGLDRLAADLETAGAANARSRAARLPGPADRVRDRGGDWAEVRQEWGLARNAAFVVGPRSITANADLDGRVFLHSYDGDLDTDGKALETIMTAPLVVGQWISSQYHFSTTAPDVFGAGDKQLHNPVGGIGVLLGQSGDLAVGLPEQSVSMGDELVHEPVRLNAVIQAPLERIEAIIQRNDGLRDLVEHEWIRVIARNDPSERWSIREVGGVWTTWWPADADAADTAPADTPSVVSEAVAR